MRNAGLDKAQAGIKTAKRNININNLRYAGDTTFLAESEEELKTKLLVKVKESETVGLKLNTHTSRLLPCPGYYKQFCGEHWGTRVSFNSGFLGVDVWQNQYNTVKQKIKKIKAQHSEN